MRTVAVRSASTGWRVAVGAVDAHAAGFEARGQPRLRLRHRRAQVHPLRLEVDGPGLDAREVEQLVREERHALDLAADAAQEGGLLVRLQVAQFQRLHERADGGDGRAQFVRDVADEVAADVVDALHGGEIDEHEQRRPAAPVGHGHGQRAQGDAIAPEGDHLRRRGAFARERAAHERVQLVVARALDEGASDHLALLHAQQGEGGGVGVLHVRVRIDGHDAVGGGGEGRLQARVLGGDRARGLLHGRRHHVELVREFGGRAGGADGAGGEAAAAQGARRLGRLAHGEFDGAQQQERDGESARAHDERRDRDPERAAHGRGHEGGGDGGEEARDPAREGGPSGEAVHGPSLPFEEVPASANRADAPGIGRIRLDFLAKPAHVNVHRSRITVEIVLPDRLEDVLAGEHLAGMSQQE